MANALDELFSKCTESDVPGLKKCPISGLYVRDRGDVGIIREQTEWNALKQFEYKGGTALDLGGHIGAAVWHILKNTELDRVVSVEPDPNNTRIHKLNWENTKNVTLLEKAVVRDSNSPSNINLYLGKTYSASNSTYPFRGRTAIQVPTICFEELLTEYDPTVIKCDVEGSEYAIDWTMVPDTTTEILLELHQFKPHWLDEQKKLDDVLLSLGFKHIKAPKHKLTYTRVCTASYSRRI